MFPTMVNALGWITPVAAVGLGVIMLGATGLHVGRHEWTYAALTLVLLMGCLFVAAQTW